MPSPHIHVISVVPLCIFYKWFNLLSLFIASVFPDVLPVLLSPVLIFVFGLKGERLNRFFLFFDQTIVGGVISAALLIGFILLLLRFFPRLSKPFKWKQNHSAKAVILSVVSGVALHIVLDKFL